jgi:hypothetical protein
MSDNEYKMFKTLSDAIETANKDMQKIVWGMNTKVINISDYSEEKITSLRDEMYEAWNRIAKTAGMLEEYNKAEQTVSN